MMISCWLNSLLLVAAMVAHSLAQDAPPSWSCSPDFHPVNNIQIGGCSDTCNATAIDELLILTRAILDLLQNQDPCCTPTPDPDECLSNPCQNDGTCTDLIDGYQCACSPGYTGTECASDIDECASNPCQNGGTCTDEINGYNCDCTPGFTGTECESDINVCASNPCQNGGTCTDAINGYSCDCTPGFSGTECESALLRDCAEIQAGGNDVSGVYTIYPEGADVPFVVYCDMETDGGGWTVFQRRQDGTVDFYLDWDSYKYGFGNVTSEHWLGNDNIHLLSTQKESELRIDLEDFETQTRYATYSSFSIGDETAKYILTVGDYSGDAGDSMTYHHNYQFTTKDQDNDVYSSKNCAVRDTGAWWYKHCHMCNLNGQYLFGEHEDGFKGVSWYTWLGDGYSLKTTEMKMRPV